MRLLLVHERSAILAVDDDADTLEILVRMLQKKGFSALGFTNPTEAIHFFQQHNKQFPVVLSDIRMPQMNGFRFSRTILEINPDVKVYLLSSFDITKAEFAKVLPSLKVAGFLRKPVSLEKLASLLEA